jgi:hypothetical protein
MSCEVATLKARLIRAFFILGLTEDPLLAKKARCGAPGKTEDKERTCRDDLWI